MDFIPESFVRRVKTFVSRYAAACILCACVIVFAVTDTSLISLRSIRDVFSNAAPLLISSAATALCLFAGYIDLSAGSAAVFAGIIAGSFVQASETAGRFFPSLPPIPFFIVIPAVLLLFFAVGACNGFIIKKFFVPPWAATLGTGLLLSALSRVYLYDQDISQKVLEGFTKGYTFFGAGYIGASPVYSVPFAVIFSIAVFALLLIVIKTFFPVFNLPVLHKEVPLLWPAYPKDFTLKETMFLYGITASLFALSGIMISARAGSASAVSGLEFQIKPLIVCFIASLSLFGGRGNWTALAVSVVIFSAFTYAADFIGINKFLSLCICAVIFLASVLSDIRARRRHAL